MNVADSDDDANSAGDSDVGSGDMNHGHGQGRYDRSSIILSIHWCCIQRIPSPSDWDWTYNADNTSISTVTTDILSGNGPNSNPFAMNHENEDYNDAGDSRTVVQISDAVEAL